MSRNIDPAAVGRLRRDVGAEAASEIVESYVESGDLLVATITTAITASALTEAGRAAHSLRSTSVLLGAVALGAACAALEQKAREGAPLADGAALAGRIERLYATFRATLTA